MGFKMLWCGNRTGHAGVRDERRLDLGWVMARGAVLRLGWGWAVGWEVLGRGML